jgi:hypothetical protein
MTDLYQSIEESRIEREGNKIDSGIPLADAVAQTREELHACEVRDCVRRYYPDGQKMADFLAKVEKARGHGAAEKLRADVRIAWAKRRDELAGQA